MKRVFIRQDRARKTREEPSVERLQRAGTSHATFVMARNSPPPLPDRPGAVSPQMNINRELLKLMRPGRIGGNRR